MCLIVYLSAKVSYNGQTLKQCYLLLFKYFLAPEKRVSYFLSHPVKDRIKKKLSWLISIYISATFEAAQPTVGHLTKLMKGCKTMVFYLLLVEHLLLQLLHHLALVVDLVILLW